MERQRKCRNFLACCLPENFDSGRMKCEWSVAVVMETMICDDSGCSYGNDDM